MVAVVHIASEMAPFAKVGGLGDVVYSLSKAMIKRGCSIEVILPYYGFLKGKISPLEKCLDVDHKGGRYQVFKTDVEGISVTLLDTKEPLFQREKIYGFKDALHKWKNTPCSPKKCQQLLLKLLKWANIILGSLVVVIPLVEPIKEFKEVLECVVDYKK